MLAVAHRNIIFFIVSYWISNPNNNLVRMIMCSPAACQSAPWGGGAKVSEYGIYTLMQVMHNNSLLKLL